MRVTHGRSRASPLEVASALAGGPSSRAQGDGLVRPCAYVVPADGATGALASELLRFASDAFSAYKRPKWSEFALDIAKTSTGKVQRYSLRAR